MAGTIKKKTKTTKAAPHKAMPKKKTSPKT
jgi:hypothetical protein